jgi:hypothetical protein
LFSPFFCVFTHGIVHDEMNMYKLLGTN